MAEITVAPMARYMIVCDEVLRDAQRQGKPLIIGLTSLVHWPAEATVSIQVEKLAVFLILTDARGVGRGQILCTNEETNALIFSSPKRNISFENKDPLGYYGIIFNLLNCRFPGPGVYILTFPFEHSEVAKEVVIVR